MQGTAIIPPLFLRIGTNVMAVLRTIVSDGIWALIFRDINGPNIDCSM